VQEITRDGRKHRFTPWKDRSCAYVRSKSVFSITGLLKNVRNHKSTALPGSVPTQKSEKLEKGLSEMGKSRCKLFREKKNKEASGWRPISAGLPDVALQIPLCEETLKEE